MKRDKIITVRVNEEIYNQVVKIINEKTTKFTVYYRNTKRNIYNYNGEENHSCYTKFSIADLIEIAFNDFIKNNTN